MSRYHTPSHELSSDVKRQLLSTVRVQLADKEQQIKVAVASFRLCESQMVFRAGKLLVEANRQLAHHGNGVFDAWIRATLDVGRSTVYKWMRVYETFGDCPHCGRFVDPSALYLLAQPSTPERARKRVIRLASKGKRVTTKDAKLIIEEELLRERQSSAKSSAGRDNSVNNFPKLVRIKREFAALWKVTSRGERKQYKAWEYKHLLKRGYRLMLNTDAMKPMPRPKLAKPKRVYADASQMAEKRSRPQ